MNLRFDKMLYAFGMEREFGYRRRKRWRRATRARIVAVKMAVGTRVLESNNEVTKESELGLTLDIALRAELTALDAFASKVAAASSAFCLASATLDVADSLTLSFVGLVEPEDDQNLGHGILVVLRKLLLVGAVIRARNVQIKILM